MKRDTVLVTGGASGLGAAIARAFHAAGFNVGIGDIDADGAVALARDLDASGETATGIALDVRDQAAFEAAHGLLVARWGSVEALVNNAALTAARPVLDITPDEFDAVLAVNLRGTFVGSQVFARAFKAAGYGRIVNLASLAGQNGGTATGAHYAVSKGGIITMTKVFARDLAPFGITVNAIAPGPLDTPMVHRTVPADRMAQFLTNVPVGQIGDPAFIASMAVRLCARDATFITGATIDINGGLYMR
ncbi:MULTISPECIES: SDR family NAD(P)-dependent oxidoreductase [unclassified Novosphingobium]|uniref:SDR family NAD(P)-dependent oxidoreductase n=1 Tax=unclassified Novosphingobium TaxID=2644732 RepID=UPI001CC205A5|nr:MULTISPECIES: SDR family NAD(P)-dependent oxidoreductase [unclassified Novosphingobium]